MLMALLSDFLEKRKGFKNKSRWRLLDYAVELRELQESLLGERFDSLALGLRLLL
jgi:hypothetical protein